MDDMESASNLTESIGEEDKTSDDQRINEIFGPNLGIYLIMSNKKK